MELIELKHFLKSLPKLNDKDSSKRVSKAKSDFAFFVQTYFAHHIKAGVENLSNNKDFKETSLFRTWVYKTLPQITHNKLCIKAYRGAAKTTLISRLFVLWEILRGAKRYAILISSTLDLAKEGIDVIKTELEDNANLINDFNIKQGSVWTNEEIVFSIEELGLCKIKSFGAGKKIRGTNFLSKRPDLIICDDIENDENIESKTQRDKLYNWFNKAILKLPSRLNPHYLIIIVGTTLHYDSLLQRLDKRDDFKCFSFPLVLSFPPNLDEVLQNLAELKQEGAKNKTKSQDKAKQTCAFVSETFSNSRKIGKKTTLLLKGLKLDDSALNPLEILSDLAQDRASFFSEFQNLPLDKENAPLAHYSTYNDLPRNIDAIIIGIDPSLGKLRGDYFALSQLFYSKEAKKIYANAQGFKITPEKMLDKIIALYLKTSKITQTITIATEEVAFQEFFKTQLKAKFQALGLFVPIVGIKNTQNKAVRLDALAPLLKDESILIDENALLLREELDSYPKCAHDDLLDSVEIALRCFNASSRTDYKNIHRVQKSYARRFYSAREGF